MHHLLPVWRRDWAGAYRPQVQNVPGGCREMIRHNPPSLLRERRQLERSREKIDLAKHRYILLCSRQLKRLSKRKKTELLAHMAKRLKESGLYSRSTYDRDIRLSILRRFYQLDFSFKKTAHDPTAWGRWLELNRWDFPLCLHEPGTYSYRKIQRWQGMRVVG